jgi:hypothetical protein
MANDYKKTPGWRTAEKSRGHPRKASKEIEILSYFNRANNLTNGNPRVIFTIFVNRRNETP